MSIPLVFTIIAVYASLTAVQMNTAIFITGYRTALLGTCTLCAINMASEGNTVIPGNFECTLATNPMWTDLSIFTDNMTYVQNLLSKALQFLQQINVRLLYGTSSDEAKVLTGDSRIDGLTSLRTLKKNSDTQTVQYQDRECFETRDGDCDIPHRIYGLTKSYHGFEALFGMFTQDCSELITKDDPIEQIKLKIAPVQQMGSLMIYDLKGGCSAYRIAMVEEQTQQMDLIETIMIVMFVVAIVSTLIGFGLLITTRSILFNVAESSSKMKELDPEADSNERTGMGPAGWKDSYACDCIRIDKQHERVLLYLAALCGSIDTSMNINEQVYQMTNSEEFHDLKETQIALSNYQLIKSERQQMSHGNEGSGMQMIDGEGNQRHIVDESALMNKTQLKDIVKKQLEIAGIVIKTTFHALFDEEHLIHNYKIAHSHKKQHDMQHAAIIRKIQSQMLSLSNSSRTKDGYTLIPSTHAQQLIRLYASWLTDHVQKNDRELVTLLIGKAPESELERIVSIPSELHVPPSYTQFLDSDNASLQDKTLFNRMIKVLKLKKHTPH
ncbi:MAG: hypothetical protein EZS28_035804 [Streblomastix strix]|uniref:Uncharacterized protein n=1 Tax=Streblomastix strix TaxID=222440 RepID=A0A5J4UDI2_9EUKA|nr:MAG: hypothetical protein EZS28_035804 [Streblomastix strix]